jgi:uncharacterized protein YkwD
MPDIPDTELKKQLLDKSNQMRDAKSVPKFTYDSRLEKSAQKHADDLVSGHARPHDQLEWRIHTFAGFPDEPCHVSRRSMPANYTEGIENQSWPIDEKSVEGLVAAGPGEGHYEDFFDAKITHIGIGVGAGRSNHMVIDYGVICDFKPEPEEVGRDSFDLW